MILEEGKAAGASGGVEKVATGGRSSRMECNTTAAEAILAALACGKPGCPCASAVRRGSGNVHCPAHADAHPSLTVNAGERGVLVNCKAGCPQEGVLEALRERGLWPMAGTATARRRISATYDYTDEAGNTLYQTVRYEPKRFAHRRPDGKGGWLWDLHGMRRVLYRLKNVVAAVKAKARVHIVEGEKDADALACRGMVATTNTGGAGNWRPEYSETLRDGSVVILPDNDEAGRMHAEQVAASLHGLAADVRIVHLPGLPDKGDVSDWLEAGGTIEALRALVAEAPEWTPAPTEDGAGLLDELATYLRRYVVLSEHQANAEALWTLHTWAFDAADATPYLNPTSAEKRSGKSRNLETLEFVVARPWLTGRVSAAVLIRKVAASAPTLLLDESDAAFKGDKEYAETLRAVLNAGHRRGGVASVCVKRGKDWEPADFPVFCPKAIAGIGKLPDTVADRSIKIELKRRAPGEKVERFRPREVKARAKLMKERLERWAMRHIDDLREARPALPDELDDRAADGWEPLLAIADAAGGDWPRRARAAAVALSAGDGREDDSLGVRLLGDLREVFWPRDPVSSKRLKPHDRMATGEILAGLIDLEDAPWGDLNGRALYDRSLARRLKPYGIKPKKIRTGDTTFRGYERADFTDAWSRYLPRLCLQVAEQAEQAEQSSDSGSAGVPDVPDVPANSGTDSDAGAATSPLVQHCLDAGLEVLPPASAPDWLDDDSRCRGCGAMVWTYDSRAIPWCERCWQSGADGGVE